MEKIIAPAPPSSGDTYIRIAKVLRLEKEVERKDKKIEKLTMQVSLLAESTKISDMAKIEYPFHNILTFFAVIKTIDCLK
ncbi:hypothetical protein [Xenorhabdus poinarii]|nr:hypothetical protein [Xenorhabdus poinarii]